METSTLAEKTIAARLAAKICGFGKHQVTPRALSQARTCIIDTVGVTLAGMPTDATQILLRTPGVAEGPGQSLIFGTDRRTSALDAALVNGTASHALDYDDFSSVFGGHQSVPLVAPLLALAEERKLSGERLVLAYMVGVETEIRLARAVHFHHYDKGWHPTSTLGTFGAAAACCHLIGLDEARTTMALAIAASSAAGIKANFGTMTKPLHVGQCGRNGLLAALLGEGGFEASAAAFEHHQGFLNVFNGPGTFDAERMFADWADPLEIASPTIGLKQFPCCGSTHPAIMMMLSLVREEAIRAEDVAKIEVLPHGRRLRHTDTPHPKTPNEAKFSVQYVTVRALLDGTVRLKDFEGEAHSEPAVRRLLDKTEARAHPDMPEDAAEQWGAEVIVTMNDGRRLSRRVDNLVGRGGDHPMTSDELWEKFDDCAQRALPNEQIAPLFERLETLESVSDINQLTRLLQTRGTRKATAPLKFAVRSEQEAPETTWVP
jgi:2-methylcitrate dehydratase PrpD